MTKNSVIKITTASLLIATLSGCAAFNTAKVNYTRNTTVGQELMDLEQAKEKGVVSTEEYLRLRKEIMKGGPMDIDWKKK